MKITPINAVGFVCFNIPNSRSWTLPSALGAMLTEAQNRFGERDMSWTILGVEIGQNDQPDVWYPGTKSVLVTLSREAAKDVNRALFQLAHEVIHLLAPSGGKAAPNVEEGLATLFADEKSAQHGWADYHSTMPKYLHAKSLTQQLLEIDPDAISKVRGVKSSFKDWTPAIIQSVVPSVPDDLASELCRPFR